jgi:hypothetical protein
MNIFISYSSKNRSLVEAIASDLESLGHDVWFDQELTGGHDWWQDILQNIRQCDLFVFALTPDSLESVPCKLEHSYAAALNKCVLPVMLANTDINDAPSTLRTIQFVDYHQPDRKSALALSRALADLPDQKPMPDPLPTPPAVPVSPLGRIRDQIDAPSLSYQEQSALLLDLKDALTRSADREESRELLMRFRERSDLLARIEKEISSLLPTLEPRRVGRFTLPKINLPPKQSVDPHEKTPDATTTRIALPMEPMPRILIWRAIGCCLTGIALWSLVNPVDPIPRIIAIVLTAFGLLVAAELPRVRHNWLVLVICCVIGGIVLPLSGALVDKNFYFVSTSIGSLIATSYFLLGLATTTGLALTAWRTSITWQRWLGSWLACSLGTGVDLVFLFEHLGLSVADQLGQIVGIALAIGIGGATLVFLPEVLNYIGHRLGIVLVQRREQPSA